ncbi:uncharacterized protein SOCG_04605 [Schizosaccharomyces octosporus yFS286]|uniref:Zn(2)-C6 fungal-type domain-containing protein n=1 Tax=Schizosaccharomyces octosporus (strain yFS286) TaxID=483514 RepID=S9Q6U4_SCHOY|nr:uncharacterized protein SOCG_04605 [Schizosaccharomyces octosporus yFS286]EPX75363.1 hypothetical protein SOCG_04605 [Schizosaccharomyces octosporus yFS286]
MKKRMGSSQTYAKQKNLKTSRIKSCNNCRKTKLKCDKKLPCSRCSQKKVGETCTYESYTAKERCSRNVESPTEELAYSGKNSLDKNLDNANKQRSYRLSYYGLYGLMDQFMKESISSNYSFDFVFKPLRLPEDIKDFCKHVPPFEICLVVCDIFFQTLANWIDIISKDKIEASVRRFFQDHFEVNDLILLFSTLSAIFKQNELPANILSYCESTHCTREQLAEEYYGKAEKLIMLNDLLRNPKSIETLQHLALHAALEVTSPAPETIVNLTRAIYYLNSMNTRGFLSEKNSEELWKLMLSVKKLDALYCIFFHGSPFMQHDVVKIQLLRFDNCFTENAYEQLLSEVCDEGLNICKNTSCLSAEEYLLNINKVEVNLSLLSMEIDLKAHSPLHPISKFQCFFLKSVLWTTKGILYLPVISLNDQSLEETIVLKDKLAESSIYKFRLITDSIQKIIEVGLQNFYFFEALKSVFTLIVCRNENYTYKDELFDSLNVLKGLAPELGLSFSVKIIDELIHFINFVYQKDRNEVDGHEGMNDTEINNFCEFLVSNYYENPFFF